MTEEVELYVPKPGSMPWLVLTFLVANPNAVLMRKDAAAVAQCPINSVDAVLQLAVVRGGLMKMRNEHLEVTWRLGDKKAFRLDKLEEGVPPFAAPSAPPPASPRAPASESLADVVIDDEPAQPEVAAAPAPAKRPYTRRVRAGIDHPQATAAPAPDELKVPYFGDVRAPAPQRIDVTSMHSKGPEHIDATPSAPADGGLYVWMPATITPQLIEAVKNDPSTSFDCKADGHHAMGWLMDAYAVLVKAQLSAKSNP